MRLEKTAEPTLEVISLTEAKRHLREEDTDLHDRLIEDLTIAAREEIETLTERQMLTASYKLYLDRFPARGGGMYLSPLGYGWDDGSIVIPRPPLAAVSLVEFADTAGVSQTVASSVYEVVGLPVGAISADGAGRVRLKKDQSWPADVQSHPDSVCISFTAGYGAEPSTVPKLLRQAMLLVVGHFFDNPSSTEVLGSGQRMVEIPQGVQRIVARYNMRVRT